MRAAREAATGPSEVTVVASGGGQTQEALLRVIVEQPPPPPALKLDLPSALELKAGGKATLLVGVQRQHFTGPVAVHFEGVPRGVALKDVAVAADRMSADAPLEATADAQLGTAEVRVIATGGGAREVAHVRLTIKAAEVAKPARAPAVEPGLGLVLPQRVELEPGKTRLVEVRVLPTGTATLTTEPTVTLTPPPASKVTFAAWSASDVKADPGSYTRGYTVRAAPDAPAGEALVRVRAAAGGHSTEGTFKVTIRKPPAEPLPPPAPELQLVLPERVAVEPGRTAFVEVRVLPKGAAALAAEPSVTLTPPPGAKIQLTPWSASDFKAAPGSSTRGYTLRVAADAPPGEVEIRVRATAAGRSVEGTFKITVRKPSS